MNPIEVSVSLKSGLSMLTGYGVAGVLDDTVVRDDRSLPCLPGTSLRGVVRAACEEVTKMAACQVPPYVGRNAVDELAVLENPEDPRNYHPVVLLFGATYFPSLLEFSTAYLQVPGESIEAVGRDCIWSETRTAIGALGTAKENALFSREAVSAGLGSVAEQGFLFTITRRYESAIDETLWNKLVGLLFCGILFADRLGSGKSRGKGAVRMAPPET